MVFEHQPLSLESFSTACQKRRKQTSLDVDAAMTSLIRWLEKFVNIWNLLLSIDNL